MRLSSTRRGAIIARYAIIGEFFRKLWQASISSTTATFGQPLGTTIGCSVTLLAEIGPIHWTTINQNSRLATKSLSFVRTRAKGQLITRQSPVQSVQAVN